MKRLLIFLLLISSLFIQTTAAQGYAFGVKGGLAVGQQAWSSGGSATNNLLFKYHGAAFIESVSASDKGQSVLFAQLGYHLRGSAFRYRSGLAYDPNGTPVKIGGFKQEFIFKNIGLILGAKRRGVLGKERAFYTVGIRGEYTVGTNLEDTPQNPFYISTYPEKDYVRKLQYGLSLSGGYEFPFSELVGGFVEFAIHPDLSRQYFRGEYPAYDGFLRQNVTVPTQAIRNISFELSIGFRFLRKIEYVD
jgi:hypothetical protein